MTYTSLNRPKVYLPDEETITATAQTLVAIRQALKEGAPDLTPEELQSYTCTLFIQLMRR